MYLRRPRKASFAIAAAHMRAWLSLLADVAEVDAEGAELPVQVRALHADALGELSHLAVTQQQLLLQVGALELLARLAQRQRQQVLLHQRLIRRGLHRELALDLLQADLFRATVDQQPVHQVPELAHVVRPGIVAQAVLRRDGKAPVGQPVGVDRSEEHTSELQSHSDLVCRLLLEKKKKRQLSKMV